jgi:methionine transaminase
VLDKNDIQELIKIVSGKNIFIISDEVYEHIIFDGLQHESLLKYPELFERSFITFSFGKVYNCTGWKIGYCVAPKLLMAEFRKVHQYNCFSCNSTVQFALADFLKQKNVYLQLGIQLQHKRDLFLQLMSKTLFKPLVSHGSYFQLYSFRDVSNETDIDFAKRLTKEVGVATIPLSAFYKHNADDHVLRFCFAKKEKTLQEAVGRLRNFQQ